VSGVSKLEFPFGQLIPPWDLVSEIASCVDTKKWMLVGGLMVQAHAMMAGLESRATVDVDLLIDVLADTKNIEYVVDGLTGLGFLLHEPGLRGAPIHRLKRTDQVVDVLIAEHLPSGKLKASKIGRLSLMETLGGSQALDRRMAVSFYAPEGTCNLYMPDVLGALVLKSAAYSSDNRNRERHLEDAALLASLVEDVAFELGRLHGSDKKRIRSVGRVLKNPNHSAWLNLPRENRARGQDVLRILGG